MIFVTLGTQDKEFPRLLEAIDKAIDDGKIKEKVVAQIGYTKYTSKNMELFDFKSQEEIDEYIKEASVVITHGGVGSILGALKYNKPVIAASRLKKYKEHANDHQVQIVKKYAASKYILELKDFNQIDRVLKKARTFKPKKISSNNDNFCLKLEKYLRENEHMSWYNKYREVLMYLVFGVLTTLVNIVSFYILDKLGLNLFLNNLISWTISVVFAFVTNKKIVFESDTSSKDSVKEFASFIIARLFSLLVDMVAIFVMVDVFKIGKMISKIISNVIVVIINYVFSKLFIFKKK